MARRIVRLALHLVVVVALAASGACVPGDPAAAIARRPIIGGSVDDAHAAVVALLGPVAGSDPVQFCTGVLIAPRAVLTAGLCLKEVSLQPDQITVYFGTTVGGDGQTIAVTDGIVHPDYAVQPDGSPKADVAILTLASDAPVAPMAWQRDPLGDLTGQTVTFVGYGVTNSTTQAGNGTRRQVDLQVTSVTDEFVETGGGTGGPCMGDAGGPALLNEGGAPVVVAIDSFGDQSCVQLNGATRVDTYADFITANAPVPCTVAITEPTDGATVDADFTVRATVDSSAGIGEVQVSVDGVVVGSLDVEPWVFALQGVTGGPHTVTVTATALDGSSGSDSVTITVDAAVTPPAKSGGCRVGGDARTAGAAALLAIALLALARRRR